MKITTLLQIPLFKFVVHCVIWVFIIINCFYHLQNWTITKRNQQSQQVLTKILQESQSFLDRDDYYHSNLYKIKSYKEEGYQLNGEIVVNPMVKEELWDNENGQFIPETINKEISNLEKWQTCFLGGFALPKNQQNLDKSINSPCKNS